MRGAFELLSNAEGEVVFRRFLEGEKDVYVVLNYSEKKIKVNNPCKGGKLMLSTHARKRLDEKMVLKPYEAMIIEA